jgi:hypothetical protein
MLRRAQHERKDSERPFSNPLGVVTEFVRKSTLKFHLIPFFQSTSFFPRSGEQHELESDREKSR